MTQEPRDERETAEDAAAGTPGGDCRPLGGSTRTPPPRADLPITAGPGRLTLGDLDLHAVRALLAELGARGSAPLESLDIEIATASLSDLMKEAWMPSSASRARSSRCGHAPSCTSRTR